MIVEERGDGHREVQDVAGAAREGDRGDARPREGRLDLLDAGAKPLHPVADVEVAELLPERRVHRDVVELLGGGVPGDDRVRWIDHHDRGLERLDHGLRAEPGQLLAARLPGLRAERRVVGRDRLAGQVRRRHALEDPPLEVEGDEPAGARQHRLGFAEEEIAALPDGVLEARRDAALEVAVEVDEDVAAEEQVDVRQRRILRNVVASEDAPLPEVAPQAVHLPLADEVLVEELAGHVLQRLEAVEGGARRHQGVLVDVGAVDLDVVLALRAGERLRNEHRERVGLLARRAARAPEAQAAGRGGLPDEVGQDALADDAPGVGVAEEAGDVDQDDVQELGELLVVPVEEPQVVLETVDVDLAHPPAHAAQERALLVLPEVEVVLEVELVEELAEPGVGGLGAVLRAGLVLVLAGEIVHAITHQTPPAAAVVARTSRASAGPMSSSGSLKSTQPVA